MLQQPLRRPQLAGLRDGGEPVRVFRCLGHEQVLTTFSSYGQVGPHRQAELIRHLAERREAGTPKAEMIDRVIRTLQETRHILE